MSTHDAIDSGALEMHGVVCDTVHAVGYDPVSQTLRVAYRSGELLDHLDVPAALFRAMLDPHPWSRVGVLVTAHESTRVDQL